MTRILHAWQYAARAGAAGQPAKARVRPIAVFVWLVCQLACPRRGRTWRRRCGCAGGGWTRRSWLGGCCACRAPSCHGTPAQRQHVWWSSARGQHAVSSRSARAAPRLASAAPATVTCYTRLVPGAPGARLSSATPIQRHTPHALCADGPPFSFSHALCVDGPASVGSTEQWDVGDPGCRPAPPPLPPRPPRPLSRRHGRGYIRGMAVCGSCWDPWTRSVTRGVDTPDLALCTCLVRLLV